MKKTLKIIFKILGVILITIFALLLIIPVFFKDTIKEKLITEAEKSVNATLVFDDFSLSLIRNFPDFSFRLEGLSLVGKDRFEGETLVGFKSFAFVFDLSSIIGKDAYAVKSVILDSPVANAIVLGDGTVNWDILIPSDTGEEEIEIREESVDESTAKEGKELKVQLKEILVKDAKISYNDLSSATLATVESFNLKLSGSLSESLTDLLLAINIKGINLEMDGQQYLSGMAVFGEFDIGADLENSVYTLNNNTISINDLNLLLDGEIKMVGDDIITDLRFATSDTEFRSLLSMVPAFFMSDYEDLKSEGMIKLDATLKGKYSASSSTLPDVSLDLLVDKASAWYKGKPELISDLSLETKLSMKGEEIKAEVGLNIAEVNVGEIMALMPADTIQDLDTVKTEMQVVEIPANIDLSFTAGIGKLLFNEILAENISSSIKIKESVLTVDETGMDILDGKVSFTALYNTLDMEQPRLESTVSARDIGIKKSYETFNTIQKLAPVAEGMDGSASVLFEFSSLLEENMMPNLQSINGVGRLESNEIELINSSLYEKLNGVVKLSDSFSNTFKDVHVEFRVEDGRVYIKPFDAKLGELKMKVGGDHGLDQTINYQMATAIPADKMPSSLSIITKGLAAQATMFGIDYTPPEEYNINIDITGTVSDPKFRPSLGEDDGISTSTKVKETVSALVDEKVEEVKEIVTDEIDKQTENLLAEAEKQAELIKAEAARSAQLVRDEAAKNAQKLIDEAESKGALARIAAKKGADTLIKEADKKALKLEEEAKVKADKLVEDARRKIQK